MSSVNEVRGHVTIEKHRKSLKFQQLLAILTLVLGVVLVVIGSQQQGEATAAATINGGLTTFGGLVWLAVVKSLMWWHHG
jgi:hypothetical protein